jgi:hypothetical protein
LGKDRRGDEAASGDSGNDPDAVQQALESQASQDAEMEDGGADAAAGQRQTDAMGSRLRGGFREGFVCISR